MNRRLFAGARAVLFAALVAVSLPGIAADPADAEAANLFLSDHGTRVVAFSSEYGSGWEAANLTPSRADLQPENAIVRPLVWSSAPDAPFPHWLLFDFGQRRWITHLVFDNFLADEADHPGISAKDIEVWVGDDAAAMTRAASFTLARNQADQAVRIEPVQTRLVKLVVASNHGHPWYTELGASRAFDDGSRPGGLAQALDAEGSVELYGLYFDFGSARLREESGPVLDEITRYAQSHPGVALALEGHTDAVGDDDANLALSRDRAEAVRQALVARGVAAGSLHSAGFGETRPVAGNDTSQGRASNRRVTLRLAREAGNSNP